MQDRIIGRCDMYIIFYQEMWKTRQILKGDLIKLCALLKGV